MEKMLHERKKEASFQEKIALLLLLLVSCSTYSVLATKTNSGECWVTVQALRDALPPDLFAVATEEGDSSWKPVKTMDDGVVDALVHEHAPEAAIHHAENLETPSAEV